jgi:hypothetical protein
MEAKFLLLQRILCKFAIKLGNNDACEWNDDRLAFSLINFQGVSFPKHFSARHPLRLKAQMARLEDFLDKVIHAIEKFNDWNADTAIYTTYVFSKYF